MIRCMAYSKTYQLCLYPVAPTCQHGQLPRRKHSCQLKTNRDVAQRQLVPHAADPSRRNKLLQRQSEGKKRLRMIGNITVPQEAFINVLKRVP
ncbi:unnamed protein product [Schistocephalus solidus]|uniref:LepA_C domain-containing protein n=1 Tax=Schistocephalus solidus TaxID=70667 RepID=A0A183SP74_SCHSO|nr:unnamed protein product [Schistocephalus solidus]